MNERERKNLNNTGNSPKNADSDWASASSWFEEKYRDQADLNGRIVNEKGEAGAYRQAPAQPEHTAKKRNASRGEKGEREKRKANGRKETRKQINNRKKLAEYYRKNRNSGKSKDELRKEYAIHAKKARKRKVAGLVALAFLLFTGIAVALSLTVLFKVAEIEVTGGTKYSAQEIIEACGVSEDDNLLLTTDKKVTKNAAAVLPYIKNISVKRDLPDKIILKVSETSAAYAVKNGKRYILIDSDGKVLEVKAKKCGKAALITGIKAKEAVVCAKFVPNDNEKFYAACEVFKAADGKKISLTKIDVSDINLLTAVCEKKIRLDLGAQTDLDKKLSMAVEIIAKLKSEGGLSEGVINLKSVTKAFFREQPIS